MDHVSDEAGRVASEYVTKHGRDALIYLDGDIAKALGTHRWDDYKLLHQVRLRLRRIQMFDQLEKSSRPLGFTTANGPKLAGHF